MSLAKKRREILSCGEARRGQKAESLRFAQADRVVWRATVEQERTDTHVRDGDK